MTNLTPANGQQTPTAGSVVPINGETYVGATHWAAILDNIEDVQEFVEESFEDSDQKRLTQHDILLWNTGPPLGKADMLANLPERHVADHLISQFFNSASPALFIIHRPSFNRHYRQFWLDPRDTSIIFIALLYAFMTLATLSSPSTEVHPDTRGASDEVLKIYKENCVQGLILSEYSKPTRYTLETMIIYGEAEFLLSQGDQIRSYLMLGVGVRLALRMGLHRDPSIVGAKFTPFDAEFRRRIWCHIHQLDLLGSFQIGLPGMMQTIESDTLPPRNLLDTDLDEDRQVLPSSRPETEMTPVTYALCKGRLSYEAGKVMMMANKLRLPPYGDVLELDISLRKAYESVPSQLRFDEPEINVTDSPSITLKRFSLSMLYEKCRCMLHRKFLLLAAKQQEFQYSKQAGLDASLKLLHRQGLMHQVASLAGPLAYNRWFLSWLQTHSFLLAAMIIYRSTMIAIKDQKHVQSNVVIDETALEALEMSHKSWKAVSGLTPDAKGAFAVLSRMIKNIYKASGRQPPLEAGSDSRPPGKFLGSKSANLAQPLPTSEAMNMPYALRTATESGPGFQLDQLSSTMSDFDHEVHATAPSASWTDPSTMDFRGQEDLFESILELPDDFDWNLFDAQIRPQAIGVHDTWPDSNFDIVD